MEQTLLYRLSGSPLNNQYEVKENEVFSCFFFDGGLNETNVDTTFNVAKDASLYIYNVVTTAHNSNLKQVINLNDQGAKVNILNVYLTINDSNFNSNIMINHLVKNTESDFKCYAIAKDNSKMTLDNNAKIVKGASKSICHQKAKGLTLSENAKIKAMPNLFIDEYDVIASHSASIGSISKDDLFYLMSRGLSEVDASKIIVLGFIKPLVDNIKDEELKKEITNSFESKL